MVFNPNKKGAEFLNKKYKELATSEPVKHEQKRKKQRGENVSKESQFDRIDSWMDVLETNMNHTDNSKFPERLKKIYHKRYVVKPEDIPENYFKNQRRLAKERGYGNVEISNEARAQVIETIITDQESTLDNWVDYFLSRDSNSFPMWLKYWSFRSMLELSIFDKSEGKFGERRKDTVAPFIELNKEALAMVVDYMIKKYGKEYFELQEKIIEINKKLKKIDRYDRQLKRVQSGGKIKGISSVNDLKKPAFYDEKEQLKKEKNSLLKEQKKLLKIENVSGEDEETFQGIEDFGKLYAYALKEIDSEKRDLQVTEGKWIKYDQGSDHRSLSLNLSKALGLVGVPQLIIWHDIS